MLAEIFLASNQPSCVMSSANCLLSGQHLLTIGVCIPRMCKQDRCRLPPAPHSKPFIVSTRASVAICQILSLLWRQASRGR